MSKENMSIAVLQNKIYEMKQVINEKEQEVQNVGEK
jgi:hypothetical protein